MPRRYGGTAPPFGRGVASDSRTTTRDVYDPLTSRYSFACPHGAEARVPLSSFRLLEQLPGPQHPAVFRVLFACGCGDEHPGLVSHDELDWAPLGAARIGAGEWPWSFFCHLEARPRPMTPSALAVVAPGESSVGVAVRCPSCAAVSVNLVTHEHVDIPFWNDTRIGVVDHTFEADALRAIEEFRAQLQSARFDERRLDLEL